jgi:hypothetical protein
LYNEEIDKDLKELESTEDVVKKYWKVDTFLFKHKWYRSIIEGRYNAGKSNSVEDDKYWVKLKNYSDKVHQLEKIRNELAKRDEVKKDIEKKESWEPIPEINGQANTNKNEDAYHCDQCLEEKKGQYLCSKTKKDGQKFCSNKCYLAYHGEYCSRCANEFQIFKKYLTVIQDGDSNYCRSCYRIVEKEREIEKREKTRYCKYCSTKLEEDNIYWSLRICKSDVCLRKLDEKVDNKENNDDSNNNPTERERERENKINLYSNTLLLIV